ncbi:MAG: CRISPR-associated endonuclease Cas2 [Candidatus Liptonbacteria bacterium]|nr:CRISPR-associated endonuclease Cas2 [Candidatus Liptonbacteria bacterium]
MKGDITLKILEIISETLLAVGDVAVAILESPYGASAGQMGRVADRRQWERERNKRLTEEELLAHRRFSNLMSNLKRQGFVAEREQNNKKLLALTRRGKLMLDRLRARHEQPGLPSAKSYDSESTNRWVIVAFDIPEKQRHKRRWFRDVLRTLDLQMIQKSVWLGKIKIPRSLLRDIKNLKLAEYIEIFEVTKTGSLEHLI